MEDANQASEQVLQQTRQKLNAQIQEAQDELDQFKKAKAKYEIVFCSKIVSCSKIADLSQR